MANQIIDKALAYIGNWMKTGKPTGYGTNVDITNYTSASNMYTIPSDGIIEINCNYRAGSYIMVYIFNATGTNSSGLVQQSSASDGNAGNSYAHCPVFKGQRVYVQSSNTYSYAYFKPFIYGVVGGVKLKVSSLALMRGWSHEQSDYRQGFGVSCRRFRLENTYEWNKVSETWWKCKHNNLHLFITNNIVANGGHVADRICTNANGLFCLYNYLKQHEYSRGRRYVWECNDKTTEWSIWRKLFGRGIRILHPVAHPERGCAYV